VHDHGRKRVKQELTDDLPVGADHEHLGTERQELGHGLRIGDVLRLQNGQPALERGELDGRRPGGAVTATRPVGRGDESDRHSIRRYEPREHKLCERGSAREGEPQAAHRPPPTAP
jgi:hypothetical protein